VLGHVFPPIIGQGFAQQREHVTELLCESLSGPPRIRPLHPCQEDQAVVRSTKVPTADPLRVPLIRSPSQWPGSVRVATLAVALGHGRHVGDRAPSIRPPRPRPARLARLTQRRQQFAAQGFARQHIPRHRDGLGRERFCMSPGYARLRRPAIERGNEERNNEADTYRRQYATQRGADECGLVGHGG
jgi:hypothetical protein